jgi:hypothetical protein
MTPEERASAAMREIFAIRWVAVDGLACPQCEGTLERSHGVLLASPWVGSVRCTQCAYRQSVAAFLGQKIVSVEPLPPGNLPRDDQDP